jgi:hypothetical protein
VIDVLMDNFRHEKWSCFLFDKSHAGLMLHSDDLEGSMVEVVLLILSSYEPAFIGLCAQGIFIKNHEN